MKKRIVEVAVKVIVAALTAFLTAITTTSCMGLGPFKRGKNYKNKAFWISFQSAFLGLIENRPPATQ